MASECTGRNVSITPALRRLADERTSRVERHLGGPVRVRVVLSHEKHRYAAEIIATHRRRRWKAQVQTDDPRAALALAFEKIDAQALRDVEKRRDRRHRLGAPVARRKRAVAPTNPAPAPPRGTGNGRDGASRATGEVRIVRAGSSPIKPMTAEEAALRMEGSGEEFVVFRDAGSERLSVLYRRRDGDYGLIVPER
ncbi:MAG TPA: ribosome-associated translation inhibitor RaiA [Thermoanaerobaculia bacterium]|jgi:putative sigma-54 modulation protein